MAKKTVDANWVAEAYRDYEERKPRKKEEWSADDVKSAWSGAVGSDYYNKQIEMPQKNDFYQKAIEGITAVRNTLGPVSKPQNTLLSAKDRLSMAVTGKPTEATNKELDSKLAPALEKKRADYLAEMATKDYSEKPVSLMSEEEKQALKAEYESIPNYNVFQSRNIDINNKVERKQKLYNNYRELKNEDAYNALINHGFTDEEIRYLNGDPISDEELRELEKQGLSEEEIIDISNQRADAQMRALSKFEDVVNSIDDSWGVTSEDVTNMVHDRYAIPEIRKDAEKHPVSNSLFTIAANPFEAALSTGANVYNYVTGRPLRNYQTGTDVIRDTVSQNIDSQFGRTVYGGAMSLGDMAAAVGTAYATGGGSIVSAGIQALEKASQVMGEGADRGLSADQIFAEGIASGLTTYVTEKIPMGKLEEVAEKGLTDYSAREIGKYLGSMFLSEGLQEGAEDIADWAMDAVVSWDKNEFNTDVQNYIAQGLSPKDAVAKVVSERAAEMMTDVVIGGISGAAVGGSAVGTGYITGKVNAPSVNTDAVMESPEALNRLIEVAQTLKSDSNPENADRIEYAKELANKPVEELQKEDVVDIANVLNEQADASNNYAQAIQEINYRAGVESNLNQYQQTGTITPGEYETQIETAARQQAESIVKEHENSLRQQERQAQRNLNKELRNFENNIQNYEKAEVAPVQQEALTKAAEGFENETAAKTYMNNYSGQNLELYTKASYLAYRAGESGQSFDTFMKNSNIASAMVEEGEISEAYLKNLYYNGQNARTVEEENPVFIENENLGKATGITSDDKLAEFKTRLAKKLGIEVNTNHTDTTSRGNFSAALARITVNATADNEYAALVHEMFEFARAYNAKGMENAEKALVNMVVNKSSEAKFVKAVEEYRDNYRRAGQNAPEGSALRSEANKTFAGAQEEFINDAISYIFSSDEGMQNLVDYIMNDNETSAEEKVSAIQAIKDWVDHLIQTIKDFISGNKSKQLAYDYTEKLGLTSEELESISRMLTGVLDTARENLAKQTKTESKESKEEDVAHSIEVSIDSVTKKFSEKEKNWWKDSKKIVLFQSVKQFEEFVKEAWQGKNSGKKIYLGKVTDEFAQKVKDELGIDIFDYNLSIPADSIRKIRKTHGDDKTEEPRGQRAITETDILEIPETILGVSRIEDAGEYFDGSPAFKIINDAKGVTIVAVATNKVLDLYPQTMYAKRNPTPTPAELTTDTDALSDTENSSFDNIVADSKENNNPQDVVEEKKDFSLSVPVEDSEGRKLSKEQQEYFKNSKVVDENGNLLVLYHGSKSAEKFTVFEDRPSKNGRMLGDGFYFTPDKKAADTWGKGAYDGKVNVYKVYLNMTNPFYVSENIPASQEMKDFAKEKGYKIDIDTTARFFSLFGEEYVKNNGYNGIILKAEENKDFYKLYGDQYVVFNANQIKKTTNKKPTENDDIRFSVNVPVEEKAKEHFGTTEDFQIAGYLLTDGTMLDFSGAHWMEGASAKEIAAWRRDNHFRQVDHEDIYEVMEASGDNRKQFMDRGNIRLSPEAPGFNISSQKEPTAAQYRMLKEFIREVKNNPEYDADRFYVDIETNKPNKIIYENNLNEDRIINDIKSYFETGEMPKQSTLDQFRYSLDVKYNDAYTNNDTETMDKLVKQAAEKAGYDTTMLYHGTDHFGFTEFIKDMLDDKNSIFVAEDVKVASSYTRADAKTKAISEGIKADLWDMSEKELVDLYNSISDTKYRFPTNEEIEADLEKSRKELQKVSQDILNASKKADADERDVLVRIAEQIEKAAKAESNTTVYFYIKEARDLKYDYEYDNDAEIEVLEEMNSDAFLDAIDRLSQRVGVESKYFVTEDGKNIKWANQLIYDLEHLKQGIYALYGKKGNLYQVDAAGANWDNIKAPEDMKKAGYKFGVATRDISEYARKNGYDGVRILNVRDSGGKTEGAHYPSNIRIYFDSSELKSADTVTYDDAGNVIPVSERFNRENNDLRYSLSVDVDEELESYGERNLNDYIAVQKAVIPVLREEGFFDEDKKEIKNNKSEKVIVITPKAIKETLGKGKRFQTLPRELKELKVATIRSLPDIIKEGTLQTENEDNYHDEDLERFDYYSTPIDVNGVDAVVRFAVKKGLKDKFWIHHIDIERGYRNIKNPDSLNLPTNNEGPNEVNQDSDVIVADNSKKSSSTRDDQYFKAYKENNTEKMEEIVRKAAEEAGYTIEAYHGSRKLFNEFRKDLLGSNTKTEVSKKWFFAADKETANSYYPYGVMKELEKQNPKMFNADSLSDEKRGKLYNLYIKMDNPLVVDIADYDYVSHKEKADAWVEYVEQAVKDGNDGIILLNAMDNQLKTGARESTIYMFKDPSQAKLSDPVVYDDNGDVIPPSERFKEGKSDMRYSIDVDAFMDAFDEIDNQVELNENELHELIENRMDLESDVSKKMISDVASNIKKLYNSGIDKKKLESGLRVVFRYLKNTARYTMEDVMTVMTDIARPVLENVKAASPEQEALYKDFVDFVKGYSIALDPGQMQEVKHNFNSYTDFKRMMAGKMKLDKNGTMLDDIWTEIADRSNGKLSYGTNPNDQPIELARYIQSLNPTYQTLQGQTLDSAATDLALEIFRQFYVQQSMTDAAEKVKDEITRRSRDMRDKYKALYNEALKQVESEKAINVKRLADEIEALTVEEQDAIRNGDAVTQAIIENVKRDYQERYDRLQAQSNDKIAQARAQYQNSWINKNLRRERSELKQRVLKEVKALQNILAHPAEGATKHVPVKLIKPTIEMLEAINLDNGGANKAIAERLKKMAEVYESFKNDDTYGFDYDERLASDIEELKELFLNRSYADLEITELYRVIEIVQALKTQIKNANNLILQGRLQDAKEAAENSIRDVKRSRRYDNAATNALNRYGNIHLNAYREFRKLSGYKQDSDFMKLYEDLDEGSHREMQIQKDLGAIFKDVLEGQKNQKEVKKFISTKPEDLVELGTNRAGKPIKITRAMRMSLILHSMNAGNMRHILGSGITVPNMYYFEKGKLEEAYAKGTNYRFVDYAELLNEIQNNNEAKIKELTTKAEERIEKMKEDLSPWEKDFLAAAEKMFHDETGKLINETSMKLKGYAIARVKNYFPIRTDSHFTAQEWAGLVRDGSLEGMGMLKERVTSTKPILLEDITNVIQRQIRSVSKYAGYAVPLRNFEMIMKQTSRDQETGELHNLAETIDTVWGANDTKWLKNLLQDIQGGRKENRNFMMNLRGQFAGATLTLNPSVAIKQAASYPTAAAVVGYKALARAAADIRKGFITAQGIEELERINPLLWYRNQGNATQELADAKAVGFGKNLPLWAQRAINWTQWFDTGTVRTLEYASMYYVDENFKNLEKGSKKYWEKVSEVFTNVVEQTQPNYSTLHKADIIRNPNSLVKMLVMFKTQPMQNFGIIYDAMGELNAAKISGNKAWVKEASSKAALAISSQVISASVFSAMTILSQLLLHRWWKYRDDDGNWSWEKFWVAFGTGALSCMTGALIGGSELYEALKHIFTGSTYYGIEVSVAEMVNDLVDNIGALTKNAKALWDAETSEDKEKATQKLLKASAKLGATFGEFKGTPVNNIKNMLSSIYYYATDIVRSIDEHELSISNESDPTSWEIKNQYERIYEALQTGDTDKYNKLVEELKQKSMKEKSEELKEGTVTEDDIAAKVEESVTSKITNLMKADYLEGNITEEEMQDFLVNERGKTEEQAYFQMRRWSTGETSDYGTAKKLISAAAADPTPENRKAVIDEIETLLAHGKEKGEIGRTITTNYKDEYISLYKEGKAADLNSILRTALKAAGYTDEEAKKKLNDWVK